MKSIQISRKSWLFRLALWGFYGWNWNLIDEIIDDVNHKKRWSFHRGRNFSTCDLVYGFFASFIQAFIHLIELILVILILVIGNVICLVMDVGRVLFGYKPAWGNIIFTKDIFSNNDNPVNDRFEYTDDWLMWRNDILTLRPIYFLAAGHFLYLMFFDSNATYFNGQSQIFQIGIEFLALVFVCGMALKLVISSIVVSGSFLLEKYRERHPKNSEENSPSLVKVVLQSVHEKTCRQLEIKD